MAENEIPLEITAETKDAVKAIESLSKSIEKSVSDINKSLDSGLGDNIKRVESNVQKTTQSISSFFNSVKGAAIAAVAVLGARELVQFFGDIISEAAEADKNVAKLNIALASTGEFSDEASKSLQEYATSIQKTTSLSDDAVLQALALAKNFGITNEQAKNLTNAAINLSAATGVDLDTAVQQLGGSLSGTAGRLSKLGPEFKNLTEEQLKAGAAIDLVNKRFDGFAENLTQTFSGAVAQARNNFGEILESLGKSITQNPLVIASINALSKAFERFAEFIGNNQQSITDFISTAIQFTLKFARPVLNFTELLIKSFELLTKTTAIVADAILALVEVANSAVRPLQKFLATNLLNAFDATIGAVTGLLEKIINLSQKIPGVSSAFEKFGVNLEELKTGLNEISEGAIASFEEGNDAAAESLLNTRDAAIKLAREGIVTANSGLSKAVGGFEAFKSAALEGVDAVLAVDASSKKTNGTLQNQVKTTNELAKANEAVKGSFEKLKTDLEAIRKDFDKQTKSAKELINIEFDRGEQLAINAELELKQAGKLKGEVIDIISQYRAAQKAKRDLANEALSIADFTISEFGSAISQQLSDFKNSLISVASGIGDLFSGSISFNQISSGFADSFKSAAESFADSLRKVKLGDIFTGFGNAILNSFRIGKDLLSGVFVTQFTDIVESFINIPQNLVNAFDRLDGILASAIEKLPEVINKLVDKLPEIGEKIASALPPVFEKLAQSLPKIISSIFAALRPIIKTLFEEVIPTLIKALPDIIRSVLAELPGIIRIILGALPEIITELSKAIPEIVKALADALPEIIVAIADRADEIVLALVEGLIGASGEIMAALVESLLVEGGLERIVVALVKAMPRVALALVQGIFRGIARAGEALGSAVVNAISAASGNIGARIGSGFSNSISAPVKNLFAGISLNFSSSLQSAIIAGFTGGVNLIPGKIIDAFNIGAGSVFSAISGAFGSVLGSIYGAIITPFNEFFGRIRDIVGSAFTDPLNSLRNAISEPFRPIIEFFRNFKIELPRISGRGSGGFVGTVTRGLEFAEGGLVPGGFPNDTFPARLTSGELIIPKDLVNNLASFLDSQSQGRPSPDINSAILGKIAALLAQPQTVETTVNVDSKAFADIILKLNRNNARLSA